MTKPQVPKRPNAARAAFADRLSDLATLTPPNHMSSEELTTMNFKVPLEFRKTYKMAALQSNVTMREILEESFTLWLDKKRGAKS